MFKSARHKTAVMLTSLLMLYGATCVPKTAAFQRRDMIEKTYSMQLEKGKTGAQANDSIKIVGKKTFDILFLNKQLLKLVTLKGDTMKFDVGGRLSCATSTKISEIIYFESKEGNGAAAILGNAIFSIKPVGKAGANLASTCSEDKSKIIMVYSPEDGMPSGTVVALTATSFLMNSPTLGFQFPFTEDSFGKGPYKADVAPVDSSNIKITVVNAAGATIRLSLNTKTLELK